MNDSDLPTVIEEESGLDIDDVIYVDLTKDPESQHWLEIPIEERLRFSDRNENEKIQFQNRFKTKLEMLDR